MGCSSNLTARREQTADKNRLQQLIDSIPNADRDSRARASEASQMAADDARIAAAERLLVMPVGERPEHGWRRHDEGDV